jgi:hypothetical protein
MLGKRSGLNGGDHPYLDHVGHDSLSTGFLPCTGESCSGMRTSPTFTARITGVRASLQVCWR